MPGINGDEAWAGANAMDLLHGRKVPWICPTGHPLSPLNFLAQVVLLWLCDPSVVLLRVTAVTSSLAALAANFLLCRRVYGARTAVTSTLILSVLPVNIVYSRIGWDVAQSLLMTVLTLYLSLLLVRDPAHALRWLLWTCLSVLAGYVTHPTNIFIVPFVLVAALSRWRRELWRLWSKNLFWKLVICGLPLATAAAIVGLAFDLTLTAGSRLANPAHFGAFLQNYARHFSGIAALQYVPGSCNWPSSWASGSMNLCSWDIVALAVLGAAVLAVGYRVAQRPCEFSMDRLLLVAWVATTLCFYLLAGPWALEPGVERYGLVLIAPGTLLLSRAVDFALDGRRAVRVVTVAAGLAAAWFLLVVFYFGYFRFFERTGGASHLTYQTASREPKLEALQYILQRRGDREPTLILSSEWWNYHPLRYLAATISEVHVIQSEDAAGELAGSLENGSAMAAGRYWSVEFADSDADQLILRKFQQQHVRFERVLIPDYAGRPLLSLVHPVPGAVR